MSLTTAAALGNTPPAAAKSAVGIGLLYSKGEHRLRAVFLCSQHGKPVMGGLCGASSDALALSSSRPTCTVPLTRLVSGVRFKKRNERYFAMTTSLRAHAPAKIPTQDKFDLLDLIERDIVQAKAVLSLLMQSHIELPHYPAGTLENIGWMLSDKLDYIETNAKALMEV